ncbi:MAG: hypothetical protein ACRDIV_10360 [Ktedonobacteraceae bacterium]
MSTFRDEEILIGHTTKKTPRPHLIYMTVDLSAQDCQWYGHGWQSADSAGAKCCTQCGITGYCPGCTSNPPQDAQPFSCTKHTPRQQQEVQI